MELPEFPWRDLVAMQIYYSRSILPLNGLECHSLIQNLIGSCSLVANFHRAETFPGELFNRIEQLRANFRLVELYYERNSTVLSLEIVLLENVIDEMKNHINALNIGRDGYNNTFLTTNLI